MPQAQRPGDRGVAAFDVPSYAPPPGVGAAGEFRRQVVPVQGQGGVHGSAGIQHRSGGFVVGGPGRKARLKVPRMPAIETVGGALVGVRWTGATRMGHGTDGGEPRAHTTWGPQCRAEW